MRINLRNAYGALIAVLPILSLYKSPIPYLDFGLFLMIGLLILASLTSGRSGNARSIKVDKDVEIWLLYVISLAISLLFSGAAFKTCLPLVAKNILYILLLVLGYGYRLIDYASLRKPYILACDLSVIVILLQSVIYYAFGKLIFFYIEPLLMADPNTHYWIHGSGIEIFRASSFFREPSHFFCYVFVGIIMMLFEEKKDIKRAFFYSIGVVCSTSGMGIVLTSLIWGIFIFKNILASRNKVKYLGFASLLLCLGIGMMQSSMGRAILQRVFDRSYTGGNALTGRLMGFNIIFDLENIHVLFGNGYGAHTFRYEYVYAPSWAFIIYGMGTSGFLIVFYIFARLWKKSSDFESKVLIFMIIILGFGHTIFNGVNTVFLVPFVYGISSRDENIIRRKDEILGVCQIGSQQSMSKIKTYNT